MGKRSDKPTIRILLFGAPGVGKGCLESTFTTTTYPPLYDASVVNSRRFLTLSPSPDTHQPAEPSTSATTTHALPRPSTPRRPRSASTTISNPASERRTSADLATTTAPPKLTLQTTNSLWAPAPPNHPLTPVSPVTTTPVPPPSTTANTAAQTYLVEVTNYPALQNPKTRSSFLSKGDYDAVLLVYDITSRSSFSAIASLHAEIPLVHKKRKRGGSVRRSRSSIFGSSHQRKGSDATAAAADDFFSRGEGYGGRETVVALVGNKCDVDGEEFGGEIDLGYPLVEKEAVLQAAEVEERSLVHPLFRRSTILAEEGALPAVTEVEPPLKSPRSVRSVPVARAPRMDADDVARRTRSVVSERASVFSVAKRGSLNLVPEEQVARSKVPSQRRRAVEVELPPTPPEEEAESAIQKWFMELEKGQQGDGEGKNVEEEVKIAKREVSKFEGEMLARTLLLNVPFRETSAKTGENVEEIFEAIVREVLWEMGKEGGGSPLERTPTEKEVKRQGGGKEAPTLGRKRSVLKKDRKEDKEPVRESLTSDLPPVLTLPGVDEEQNESKTPVHETVEEAVETAPEPATMQASEPAPKQRRESFLGGFFKRVFMKKPAPAPAEVAV